MNPLLIATVFAVLTDSVVTIIVGLRLNSTAERKIQEGVNNIIENAPIILAKAMTPKVEGDNGENQS
jgi:hypothetical protein